MKKILLCAVMMLVCIVAQAEVYYYIESGTSPESSNGSVQVIVKDNSGQLWILAYEDISSLRQNLLNNRNFYVDLFNKGSHIEPVRTLPFTGSYVAGGTYHENIIFNGNKIFHRMILLEKTQKCYVLQSDYSFFNKKDALSFDYKTLIHDCDKVSPSYYTSVPVDRFIVRRSVDDLF